MRAGTTMPSSTPAMATAPITHWTAVTIQVRSRPCSAAAKASSPADPSPPASAQMPTCTNGEPVNAEAAKAVKQPGKAKQVFADLFAQIGQ